MGPPSSVSAAVLGLAALSSLLVDLVEANLRCYSCAPCNEFEFFAGDVHHFEVGLRSVGWDVRLKFHDMKISHPFRPIAIWIVIV